MTTSRVNNFWRSHVTTMSTFILLAILCQLATSDNQPFVSPERYPSFDDSVDAEDRYGSGYARAQRPTIPDDGSGHRSTILFPEESSMPVMANETLTSEPNALEPRRFRGMIPLSLLRQISGEKDLSKIFQKYVTNVKVQDADGQKYLVDLRGQPIEAGLEGRVKIDSEPKHIQMEKVGLPNKAVFTVPNRHKQAAFTTPERVGIPSRVTKPAVCEPELRTVEIPAPNDPSIIQFPKCVRLDRCGGCCGSDLLICEPTRSIQTEVQVQKFAYNDETEKLEYRDTEVMILPSHTGCRCNCRVKAADCSQRHVYNSEDCLCNCKNRGEQELCAQRAHKLWDATLCQCVCREIKVCSSGYTFNIENCECVLNLERRRQGLTDDDQNSRRNRREHSNRIRLLKQLQ